MAKRSLELAHEIIWATQGNEFVTVQVKISGMYSTADTMYVILSKKNMRIMDVHFSIGPVDYFNGEKPINIPEMKLSILVKHVNMHGEQCLKDLHSEHGDKLRFEAKERTFKYLINLTAI